MCSIIRFHSASGVTRFRGGVVWNINSACGPGASDGGSEILFTNVRFSPSHLQVLNLFIWRCPRFMGFSFLFLNLDIWRRVRFLCWNHAWTFAWKCFSRGGRGIKVCLRLMSQPLCEVPVVSQCTAIMYMYIYRTDYLTAPVSSSDVLIYKRKCTNQMHGFAGGHIYDKT